ncbi:hypothetical protein PLANTIT3_90192 [Plantibacter sp. T3]|nr:hypothetical protein PLANTIT3_90192 [Plantibacter sp. T3]
MVSPQISRCREARVSNKCCAGQPGRSHPSGKSRLAAPNAAALHSIGSGQLNFRFRANLRVFFGSKYPFTRTKCLADAGPDSRC